MAKRKAIPKKVRFEIFKRDKFTCQYCGKQPPEVVLVIDHINPVALGGDNDEMNLITSCESCNQGKGANSLDQIINRPDAEIESLEVVQELLELKRYQDLKKKRDEIQSEIIEELQLMWWELLDEQKAPSDKVILGWLVYATPQQIEDAIKSTIKISYKGFQDKLNYCSAAIHIMTGRRKQ